MRLEVHMAQGCGKIVGVVGTISPNMLVSWSVLVPGLVFGMILVWW